MKKFSLHIVLLPLFCLLLAAISCKEKPKIKDKIMVNLMCDAMLIEAGNQIQSNYAWLPDSIWAKHYGFICTKHGVPYEDFKAELIRLKAEPEAFSQLMERVITQMQMAELNARKTKR